MIFLGEIVRFEVVKKPFWIFLLLAACLSSGLAWSADCLGSGVSADFESEDKIRFEGREKSGDRKIFRSIAEKNQHECDVFLGRVLNGASIRFQGGTGADRHAKIGIPPVKGGSGNAISFGLKSPYIKNGNHVSYAGRVQLNVYDFPAAKTLEVKVRMLLPASLEKLSEYPGEFRWLTISEWWNNASWLSDEPYPFRLTLNLVKLDARVGSPLRFLLTTEVYDRSRGKWLGEGLMSAANAVYNLPFGRWVLMKYTLVEGDGGSGRFRLDVAEDGGPFVNVFDLRGLTHHPRALSPDGFTHFNPIKLYTSSRIIDFMRFSGEPLTVWWDDLEIRGW